MGSTDWDNELAMTQADADLLEHVFDADWYRRHAPASVLLGQDPEIHFLVVGWREGCAPCEAFDLGAALQVPVEEGFEAYLRAGLKCDPRTYAHKRKAIQKRQSNVPRYDPRIVSEFDPVYYLAHYGKDLKTEKAALEYFMTEGWKKNHNPSKKFDTAFYLETYADIRNGGLNPFEHFILFGRDEGRLPARQVGKPMRFDPMARSGPAHMSFLMDVPRQEGARTEPGEVDFDSLDIHWVVPDFARGGGGHMTIFRMIRHLEAMGHRCTIWIERRDFHSSASLAYDDIVKHFQCVRAEVKFLSSGFSFASGDVIVATGWTTAHIVAASTGFKEKFYFVQDFESAFYARGADSLLAEESYHFDLSCICASPWLAQKMVEFGRWSRPFYLAYDHEIYKPEGEEVWLGEDEGYLRLCVYARGHTPRRATELIFMALDELGRRGLPIEVHFYGQENLEFEATPYKAINHGVLDAEGLASLYRSCDLGICFSATNYSLIPQEMMACGLPLVELDVESTRAIFPEGVVTLSGPHPKNIADRIENLIFDKVALDAQRQKALEWVAQFDWAGSAQDVVEAFKARLRERGATQIQNTISGDAERDVIDIVIPTWNGMGELEPVIEAIRAQKGRARPNIICVDSSSTDGTTEWLAAQPDITLKVIPQSEFQHGATRNLGASLGSAPLIVFLTQDAIPAHAGWLHDIWAMMTHFQDAAGLFGRHIAYPDHSERIHEELDSHFAQFMKYPLKLSKSVSGDTWGHDDIRWQQILHFYSDNNSCMRRSVWQELPYPEVDYGEDQVWAHMMIEAGYDKVYAPTATVIHSHDYGPEETYKRCKIEADFFYTHFGYKIAPTDAKEIETAIQNEQAARRRWFAGRDVSEKEAERQLAVIAQKYRGYAAGLRAALAR